MFGSLQEPGIRTPTLVKRFAPSVAQGIGKLPSASPPVATGDRESGGLLMWDKVHPPMQGISMSVLAARARGTFLYNTEPAGPDEYSRF